MLAPTKPLVGASEHRGFFAGCSHLSVPKPNSPFRPNAGGPIFNSIGPDNPRGGVHSAHRVALSLSLKRYGDGNFPDKAAVCQLPFQHICARRVPHPIMPLDGARSRPRPSGPSGWFAIPAPLTRLFKKFPLLTYPPNELPARSPDTRDVATLYVFISDKDALKGFPSYNPSCLKWQTFLKLAGVDFRLLPSNNHASPTGALPFLLPPSEPHSVKSQIPIPSNKLEQYALDNSTSKIPDVQHLRLEAYESLLDHRIRNAWLYHLYLSPANSALLSRLYVAPVSTSAPVRTTILHQLRRAAEAEILRSTRRRAVVPAALYSDASEAFSALETALDSGPWFFDSAEPGLFDVTVFAYTHLILDDSLAWEDRKLTDILKEFPGLVEHRDRILQKCWGL
ncbi:hypothetical protein F5X99DRAFT_384987 [Biscogniauxia marginata]|nr:hypothetical protein F5X99DRAFT_384987 [Biscogniauxia marginata]